MAFGLSDSGRLWVGLTLASIGIYTLSEHHSKGSLPWIYPALLKSFPCLFISAGVAPHLSSLGFLLSAVGDFFLAYSDGMSESKGKAELGFLLGLASFLISQWVYVASFLEAAKSRREGKAKGKKEGGPSPTQSFFMLVSYVIAGSLYQILVGQESVKSAGLAMPVLFYCFSIASMLASSIFSFAGGSKLSVSVTGILGALLFVVSDGYLSLNMFLAPMPHSRLVIMSTYFAAQVLLGLAFTEEKISM